MVRLIARVVARYAGLRQQLVRDNALEKMWAPIMDWIHSPGRGKKGVFDAYTQLTTQEKAALEADVARAFRSAHGGNEVIAYRYKDQPGSMGGMSLTTEEPKYLSRDQYTAYKVHASDVLAHWGQDDLPLSGKAFGHEKELILKPNANPKIVKPEPEDT